MNDCKHNLAVSCEACECDRLNGNYPKCYQCHYYKPHQKASLYHDGECLSVAHNTERGYLHRVNGNDFTSWNNCCKWFFLPEDVPLDEQTRMEL